MFQQLRTRKSDTLDMTDIGIALVNKDGYFLKVNHQLECFLGYTQEELTKLRFQDITFPEDLQTSELLFKELLNGILEQYQIHKRYIRKDGKIVKIKVTVTAIEGRKELGDVFLCKFQNAQIIGDSLHYGFPSEQDTYVSEFHGNEQLLLRLQETVSTEFENPLKNRRKYFRIKLHVPWCAFMRIMNENDIFSQENYYKVCIVDIGPGGLRFSSDLKLAVDRNVVLEFILHVSNENICLFGSIVHKIERNPRIIEYGVQFNIDDAARMHLTQILNDVMIKMKKHIPLRDTNLCDKYLRECFK